MTTKKKSTSKSGEKTQKTTASKAPAAKTMLEPAATATRATLKTEKAAKAVAPTAPAVVAAVLPVEAPAAPVAAPAVQIEVAVSTAPPVLTIGMFQKRLHERGYYHGWWDGQYGPLTKQAVASFQAAHGLHADGEPTPATLAKLGF